MNTEDLFPYIRNMLSMMPEDEQIATINELKVLLHSLSPFAAEPVDCVLWVPAQAVEANDYNPNTMGTAEKRLLLTSLKKDGFTQPIVVSNQQAGYVVVDGFHRHVLGQSDQTLKRRLKGYLPVVCVRKKQSGKDDRIAATIRHNRARGRHAVDGMSDIIRDLARLGWADEKIARELGMEADEVLRLKQISGLSEVFADEEYSEAWTVE